MTAAIIVVVIIIIIIIIITSIMVVAAITSIVIIIMILPALALYNHSYNYHLLEYLILYSIQYPQPKNLSNDMIF